jgi:hypothetical protein
MVSVQSKPVGYYFVVGSYQPGRAEAAKGGGVHSLKINVSWVKNVARQFGCNFARCIDRDGKSAGVRKEIAAEASGVGIVKWHVSKLSFME